MLRPSGRASLVEQQTIQVLNELRPAETEGIRSCPAQVRPGTRGGAIEKAFPEHIFDAHRMTRGQRDFSSIKALEAERYAVLVDAEHLSELLRISGPQ